MSWLVVAFVGGSVGTIAGLFGVGGGFLLVPALTLLVGVEAPIAVGSSACQVLGPATTALMAREIRVKDLRMPIVMIGGLAIGVYFGAMTLEELKARAEVINPADVVNGIYLVLMISLGLFSLFETWCQKRGTPVRTGWLVRIPLPPLLAISDSRSSGISPRRVSLPILGWFGLAVGYLSGLLGMSGGLVLIPGLVYLWGQSMRSASVTGLVIVWIISVLSTVVHAWNGNVDLKLVIAMLLGGTIGAKLGTGLAGKLGGRQLRQGFGWLLLSAATFIAVMRFL